MTIINRAKNDPKITWSFRLSLIFYTLLILTISLWNLWLNPPSVDSVTTIWAVQVIPLLLLVIGFISRNPRSFAWICFAVLFYFSAAVVNTYQEPESLYGWLLVCWSAGLFTSAACFIRWQSQQLRYAQQSLSQQ